jgi:hypothetical protein
VNITDLKGFDSPCVVLSGQQAMELSTAAYREAKPHHPVGVALRIVEHAFDLERDKALQAGGLDLGDREPARDSGGFEIS